MSGVRPVPVRREDYPHWASFATRWNDNDVYGHVNNTVHYLAMDTVINQWLIEHAGLRLDGGAGTIGLCVESGCTYAAPVSYPQALEVGLRCARLGTSSVTWEVVMLRQDDGIEVARGRFVHVFVDPLTRRPQALSDAWRRALGSLMTPPGPV